MKNLMLNCKQATMLIIKNEESKLPLGLKIRLEIHLYLCKLCKLFVRQSKFISKNISPDTEIKFTETEKKILIQKLSS